MSDNNLKGTAVVTGASNGIGAAYAEQLALRGYDLVLVARRKDRLDAVAQGIVAKTGVKVEVFPADLGRGEDVGRLEARLASDEKISLLVNNAGTAAFERFAVSNIDGVEQMIAINITALTRLTRAVLPGFVARNAGTVVNVSSALGVSPWVEMGTYSASKSYVLAFTRALQKELEGTKVLAQILAPAGTATTFWDDAGLPLSNLPPDIVMTTDDVVKAAMLGLERRETAVFPSLPEIKDWEKLDEASASLTGAMQTSTLAARYGA